jgi:hypothetical protein
VAVFHYLMARRMRLCALGTNFWSEGKPIERRHCVSLERAKEWCIWESWSSTLMCTGSLAARSRDSKFFSFCFFCLFVCNLY